jgi:hypothetical protein
MIRAGANHSWRFDLGGHARGMIEGFHNQTDAGLIAASDMLSSQILCALLVARGNSRDDFSVLADCDLNSAGHSQSCASE